MWCDKSQRAKRRIKKKKSEEENEETHFGDIMGWCLFTLVVRCRMRALSPLWGRTYLWTFPFEPVLPSEITYYLPFFFFEFFFFSEHTPIESPFCSVASASATLTSLTRFIYVVCLLCVDSAIASWNFRLLLVSIFCKHSDWIFWSLNTSKLLMRWKREDFQHLRCHIKRIQLIHRNPSFVQLFLIGSLAVLCSYRSDPFTAGQTRSSTKLS